MNNEVRENRFTSRGWRTASYIYLAVMLVLLYAPVIVMIRYSFNDSRTNVVWQGFTTKYYVKLYHDPALWEIFFVTLFIAVCVTLLGTVIGTLGAVGFARVRFPGKRIIEDFIYFPLVLPEIVLGIALLLLFNFNGIRLGIPTIIIGDTTLVLPYVFVTVKARLSGMDPSVEEASIDLGADRMYTFFHITMPAIMPAVISGAFMSFSLVLDELILTSFLADAATVTLPMKIYSMIKRGVTPEINALTTIIFIAVTLAVVIYLVASEMKDRKRLREEERRGE